MHTNIEPLAWEVRDPNEIDPEEALGILEQIALLDPNVNRSGYGSASTGELIRLAQSVFERAVKAASQANTI